MTKGVLINIIIIIIASLSINYHQVMSNIHDGMNNDINSFCFNDTISFHISSEPTPLSKSEISEEMIKGIDNTTFQVQLEINHRLFNYSIIKQFDNTVRLAKRDYDTQTTIKEQLHINISIIVNSESLELKKRFSNQTQISFNNTGERMIISSNSPDAYIIGERIYLHRPLHVIVMYYKEEGYCL